MKKSLAPRCKEREQGTHAKGAEHAKRLLQNASFAPFAPLREPSQSERFASFASLREITKIAVFA